MLTIIITLFFVSFWLHLMIGGPRQTPWRWLPRFSRRSSTITPKPFTTTPPSQKGPYDLKELFKRLDLAPGFQSTEKPAYRQVSIPKRNGRKRRLQIPDAPTHAVQRKILRLLLQRIPVHEAATGFEKGKSIVDHAQPHTESEVVICLDLVDFFPSTHSRRVEAFFQRIGWNPETARWLTTWVCFNGGLPQGAPTSPKLSNLVNYLMDRQLQQSAERQGFRYTRYADDLTFSFSKHSNSAPPNAELTKQLIRRAENIVHSFGYRIHHRKTRIRRKHQQQKVTGLVVNSQVGLPRKTKRWLRSVAHHHRTGKEATLSEAQLAGWVAFQNMIESPTRDSVATDGALHSAESSSPNLVPAKGLTQTQFSEAILSIHNESFRSPERTNLIHSLTGCQVEIEGQLEENLPTLPSKTDRADYQGGRTLVLRLKGEGGLVEVLISNRDSERIQYATYGDPQAMRGIVMGWCDRFDRPQIACQKFLSR